MQLATVLVPLDGSALAEYALPYATRLAQANGGRLVLVRAAADPVARQRAEEELAAVAGRLFAAGVPVEAHARRGPAGDVILGGARAWEAGLIVMATRGRSGPGRLLYGSVADHVLRQAPVPVLLVSGHCERRWPAPGRAPAGADAPPPGESGRVLVPLDGSGASEAALGPAADLAGALGAGLLLAQVVPAPPYVYGAALEFTPSAYDLDAELAAAGGYLEEVAARLRAEGRDVATATEAGLVAPAIARIAREQDVAAIAMATHGRGGLARAVLGSVATGVLQLAGVPLLLTRPAALAPTAEAPAALAGVAQPAGA